MQAAILFGNEEIAAIQTALLLWRQNKPLLTVWIGEIEFLLKILL